MDEKPSDTKDREPLETMVHVPGRGTWPSRGSGQTAGLKSGHAGASGELMGQMGTLEAGGQCKVSLNQWHQGTCTSGPWVESRLSPADL